MRMKQCVKNSLGTLAVLSACLVGVSGNMQAQADQNAPTKIESKTDFPSGTKQGLLLSPDTDNTPVSVTISGDATKTAKSTTIEAGKGTYASFDQKYGSQLVSLFGISNDTQLKPVVLNAKYGVVGATTTGDPVTASVEISNMQMGHSWDTGKMTAKPGIEFSNSLFDGFDSKGIKSMDFKITFTDKKTNKEINFDKDAYISWNSLNPNVINPYNNGHAIEAVAYLSNDGNNKSYITNDSVIEQYKSPYDNSLTLTGGSKTPKQSYDEVVAEDKLGATGFQKHSVSYLLSGTTQEFSINSINPLEVGTDPILSKSNPQDYWFAPSTATVFTPTAEKPTKKVVDPTTKADMNEKQVKDGQALQYQVSQKVAYLGKDTLERYSSMTFTDKLPAGFVYKNAYLADADGKKIEKPSTTTDSDTNSSSSSSTSESSTASTSSSRATSESSSSSETKTTDTTKTATDNTSSDWAGTASFDKASNTVTYTASKEFLSAMKMDGETYKLIIDGTVDTSNSAKVLENQAQVAIDNKSADTNKVTNTTTPPAAGSLSKTVTVDGKTGTTGEVTPDKAYSYQLNAKIADKSKMNSLEVSDPLEKVQTYESATVNDSTGKDITDQGTLTFDKATNTVKWVAKTPSDFSGKTINMNIKVKLNGDADLSAYKVNGKIAIPNVGQLKTDDGTTPSNPTSVTIPTVEPSAHKSVQLTGEEPNGSNDKADTATSSSEATSNSSDDQSSKASSDGSSNDSDANSTKNDASSSSESEATSSSGSSNSDSNTSSSSSNSTDSSSSSISDSSSSSAAS